MAVRKKHVLGEVESILSVLVMIGVITVVGPFRLWRAWELNALAESTIGDAPGKRCGERIRRSCQSRTLLNRDARLLEALRTTLRPSGELLHLIDLVCRGDIKGKRKRAFSWSFVASSRLNIATFTLICNAAAADRLSRIAFQVSGPTLCASQERWSARPYTYVGLILRRVERILAIECRWRVLH